MLGNTYFDKARSSKFVAAKLPSVFAAFSAAEICGCKKFAAADAANLCWRLQMCTRSSQTCTFVATNVCSCDWRIAIRIAIEARKLQPVSRGIRQGPTRTRRQKEKKRKSARASASSVARRTDLADKRRNAPEPLLRPLPAGFLIYCQPPAELAG